ncbi:MAG: ATP phosphoribosyltransferase regulatory subunit, partial [Clostridia bacterium]|nr:ATP phosphoribosyltransferase regulatory subunit [Clostridia bacterium]
MELFDSVLKNEEKAIFKLRSLYGKYGYTQYKMSKFEEYDLYVRNKDFLVSDSIITFTDTNGKLLALKPDVTLSIIKNTKEQDGCVQKVYYNENVYRVSKGTSSYKEIMQTGLECLGDIDTFNIYEVLMLACESLKSISDECVLDITHLGILSDVINYTGLSGAASKKVLKCIGDKNLHEIKAICSEENVSSDKTQTLINVVSSYGSPSKVITELKNALNDTISSDNLKELEAITSLLVNNGYGDMINIDFSVINNMSYYNGIVFKGFINNIPTGVLSGGEYDKLMKKMGKNSRAIGFAVYLDLLERLTDDANEYDVDTVILYNENDDINTLNNAIKMLTDNGKSVVAQ